MPRPESVVLMTGCGTGVGKTWVGVQLLESLRHHGISCATRKPVQSYTEGDLDTDAELLARAVGVSAHEVCPPHRWYPLPLAPPIAAELLGRPPYTLNDLVAELAWSKSEMCLIEGSGGVRSPLATDGDTAALARAIRPDKVVLVADASLGAIHAVRSSTDGLDGLAVIVFLNRFQASNQVHQTNCYWLAERDGYKVATHITDLVGLVLSAMG